jgi:hypothetical protein
VDRHDFIKKLAEACPKTGWQVTRFPVRPYRPGKSWVGMGSQAFSLGFHRTGFQPSFPEPTTHLVANKG